MPRTKTFVTWLGKHFGGVLGRCYALPPPAGKNIPRGAFLLIFFPRGKSPFSLVYEFKVIYPFFNSTWRVFSVYGSVAPTTSAMATIAAPMASTAGAVPPRTSKTHNRKKPGKPRTQ